MNLRQREPRIKDNKHLDFIRSLPCCICGGIDTEAAHIRTASLAHGKQHTGMSEKPSDKWTLPLCNKHHREQHTMNELEFWKSYGIDPFMLALTLKEQTRPRKSGHTMKIDNTTMGGADLRSIVNYPKG